MALGCGGSKMAPVSGVVTLNGKPYKDAIVSFQPISTSDNPNPGRGSDGRTDGDGHYKLMCEGTDGAVVGKHKVRIRTYRDGAETGPVDPTVGTPDNPDAGR